MAPWWHFSRPERTVLVSAPAGLEDTAEPLSWLANDDIGTEIATVEYFVGLWRTILDGTADDLDGTKGNSTLEALRGDVVVIESLFDLWPTVSLPAQDFRNFLEEFLAWVRAEIPQPPRPNP